MEPPANTTGSKAHAKRMVSLFICVSVRSVRLQAYRLRRQLNTPRFESSCFCRLSFAFVIGSRPMRLRKPTASDAVLGLLCLMYLITYIDRVNVATAAGE